MQETDFRWYEVFLKLGFLPNCESSLTSYVMKTESNNRDHTAWSVFVSATNICSSIVDVEAGNFLGVQKIFLYKIP